jgi:bifunctional DNase/RNase
LSDTQIAESKLSLRDAQAVIAREYDFEKWADLKEHVAELARSDLVEMQVDGMRSATTNYQRVVVLRAKDSQRYLPIWIGPSEAHSIALKLQGIQVPRPLTYDLLEQTISDLGATVSRVIIIDIRATTFYASVVLQLDGNTIERDSRPSDAIGLAVRAGAPIFASQLVLDRVGVTAKTDGSLDLGPAGWDLWATGILTQRATAAIATARREAERFNHNAIGTEHLLIGLLGEKRGVGARALVNLGKVAYGVEAILQPGKGARRKGDWHEPPRTACP